MADEEKPGGWQRPESAKDVDKQLQRNSLYDMPGGGVEDALPPPKKVQEITADDGGAAPSKKWSWRWLLVLCSRRPTGSSSPSRGSVAMNVRMPELDPMAA